jgi:polar amino acid transport system substrate-binding protein
MVLADGSLLTRCINRALAALEADGTLADLETEWLRDGGSIPTLTD